MVSATEYVSDRKAQQGPIKMKLNKLHRTENIANQSFFFCIAQVLQRPGKQIDKAEANKAARMAINTDSGTKSRLWRLL